MPSKVLSVSARTKLSAVTGTAFSAETCVLVMAILQSSERISVNLLYVRQLPGFVEEGFLRAVETEEDFESSIGIRRNPVRVFACWRFGSEVDIHRTVGILLQSRGQGGAAGPLHVADESVGVPIIGGGRPVLCDGRIRGHVDAIGVAALQ